MNRIMILGILGMFVLLVIAILFSKNRKAINWRTVGFGLTAQLVLAIGVLKVPFVQAAFEWVGGLFIAILDFTMAGTKFLFDSFITGEIGDALITFAVTILPTIIFFSALTSVLFYLGIIQKVVRMDYHQVLPELKSLTHSKDSLVKELKELSLTFQCFYLKALPF